MTSHLNTSESATAVTHLRQRVVALETSALVQRHAASRLQESELQYRRLFEAAQDGILILDALSGEIEAVNPFLAELLGYTAPEIVGKKLWQLGPFQDATTSKIAFRELQGTSYIRYEDLPLQARDGRAIAVEFVSNVYVVGGKKVIQCNIRDITARKRANAQLQLQSAALEAAANGIVITDRAGRLEWVNSAFTDLTGYTLTEAIGKTPGELLKSGQHDRTFYQQVWETILAGRVWRGEMTNRRKDGSLYTEEQTITPVRDKQGEISHFVGVKQDVTARHQSLEALRLSEERMRFALEAANVGIWDMDHTTGTLHFSETLEAQYGLAPGTFSSTLEAAIALFHPEDQALVRATIAQAMRVGGDFTLTGRTIWPDGSIHWLSGVGREYLDDEGRPRRATGVSLDVTARRLLQDQYRQAQKMEAIGRLASGLAHDFNNLLTVILGFSELLLDDGDLNNAHRADITEIQMAGVRAAGLTRQLLAFSRKEIIEPKVLDLNLVVADMRTMLARLIGEDISMRLDLAPGRVWVKADRGQLEQVVMNLAVNARDAMPTGGMLMIATALADLDAHDARAPGSYVILTVTDTGTGMTPEVQAHLFEPFFTTKDVGRGTGLGLATVQGIVAGSGGTVDVASTLGQGTSFRVCFPQAEAVAAVLAAPPVPAAHAGGHTVLVVEDAAELRAVTKRLLERLGYQVMVAANADEAVQVFQGHASIDVLLTDVVMPGASGPELTRRLLAQRPSLKVLYMSGYTDEAIVQHGVLQPGIAFLHKPFTSAVLGDKIREVLDR